MDTGERATGTPNEEYNLVSVLYHALHGAETCEMYALDADRAGNDELASFFRNVQATQTSSRAGKSAVGHRRRQHAGYRRSWDIDPTRGYDEAEGATDAKRRTEGDLA